MEQDYDPALLAQAKSRVRGHVGSLAGGHRSGRHEHWSMAGTAARSCECARDLCRSAGSSPPQLSTASPIFGTNPLGLNWLISLTVPCLGILNPGLESAPLLAWRRPGAHADGPAVSRVGFSNAAKIVRRPHRQSP